MEHVCEKKYCTGCGACRNICPNDAISMKLDREGFLYPYIESQKCSECGLCKKRCPAAKGVCYRENLATPIFFAAQLKNKEELQEVSSGGAGWALMQYVLSQHGVVYGAVSDDVDSVCHIRSERIEDAVKCRRSKYFQSDIGDIYRNVKKDLLDGRLVLFTGVGCQIAGLYAYLNKDYSNLISADIICHGVPSQYVWKKYREMMEASARSRLKEIIFRDKSAGWKNNQYKMVFENGTVVKQLSTENPFHRGYLLGLYSRSSCGRCKYNLIPRMGDFSLADYWQYNGEKFENDLSLGVSLMAVNSIKAANYLDYLKEFMEIEQTSSEKALISAKHMNSAPIENPRRNDFFNKVFDQSFDATWREFIKENGCKRFMNRCRVTLGRIKRRAGLFIKKRF